MQRRAFVVDKIIMVVVLLADVTAMEVATETDFLMAMVSASTLAPTLACSKLLSRRLEHQHSRRLTFTAFPVRPRYLPRSLPRPNNSRSTINEMGDATITTSAWRLVEVGRVVLFNEGVYEGRLATIVEIIDHKRVWTCCELGD